MTTSGAAKPRWRRTVILPGISLLTTVRSGLFLFPQNGIRRGEQFGVVVIRQLAEETADAVERLLMEQLGRPATGRSRCAVLRNPLQIGIQSADHAGGGEQFHGRASDPFL